MEIKIKRINWKHIDWFRFFTIMIVIGILILSGYAVRETSQEENLAEASQSKHWTDQINWGESLKKLEKQLEFTETDIIDLEYFLNNQHKFIPKNKASYKRGLDIAIRILFYEKTKEIYRFERVKKY